MSFLKLLLILLLNLKKIEQVYEYNVSSMSNHTGFEPWTIEWSSHSRMILVNLISKDDIKERCIFIKITSGIINFNHT